VRPGGVARYAIFVWITAGKNVSAKIHLTVKPKSLSPVFTVCQPAGHATCKLSGLTAHQAVELQAKIVVPKNADGTRIHLTASGTSPQAKSPASASNTMRVKARPKASPSPTPTPTPPTPGIGSLPPGALPPGLVPPATVPGLPNPASNAASAFPQLSPSASPSPASQSGPHNIKVADVSATVPLDVRLIGGQVLGLAILAAAVTIAVARLSLRKRAGRGNDSS